MGYQITDNLTFSNQILKDTLSGDDKKEIMEATMRILSILNKKYFFMDENGNADFLQPNIESIRKWCECIESKLELVNKFETKNDDEVKRKDSIIKGGKNKIKFILKELNMMLDLYASNCQSDEDKNRRNICLGIMETDIVNNMAHILSSLQVKGEYEADGQTCYVIDDVFKVKDMKMKRLVKRNMASIVRDTNSQQDHKYSLLIDLPNADAKIRWHMPNWLSQWFLKQYQKQVILPNNDIGKKDQKQLIDIWKIRRDKIVFESPDKFVFDSPDSIFGNQGNMTQIEKIYTYFFSKLGDKADSNTQPAVSGRRNSGGPSCPGD